MTQKNPSLLIRDSLRIIGIYSHRKLLTMDKMKKILVVDDESDVCFVLQHVLSENGYVVDSYENPTLALENFKPHSYSLVILDIKMPDLNGFALYREIKKLDKRVQVCFLTAGEMYYGANSDIFSSLPANHFIRKPIDNEVLVEHINDIIAQDIRHIIALNHLYPTN